MGYRIRAGLRRFTRRVVLAIERAVGKPISRTTKYELMMSATSRNSFAWAPAAREEEKEGPNLFVRVEPDIPVIEEEIEMPVQEKVYSTPSYSTITTPTSSGAVMYEFSGRFDIDQFGMEDAGMTESQAEVYEAPAIRGYAETEEERQYFENLYEDLTVDAVLEYMDTIELYAKPKEHVETDEERKFFEDLYDDLAVEAVLSYMDTVELYAAPKEYAETEGEKQFFEGLYDYLAVDAVLEYMETVDLYASPVAETETKVEEQALALEAPSLAGYIEAPVSAVAGYLSAPVTLTVEDEPTEFYENLYEDLEVEAVLDYMDTIELYAKPKEHIETEEEKRFYESVYEDLTVFAVLDYMDTIELYASKPAPEYVISEIEMPQEAETKIIVEPARPSQLKQSILTQFVFGFDAPAKAKAGTTKFRFIAGEEEEPEEDVEDVQIMTYTGDAAVSAQSVSNGSLAL